MERDGQDRVERAAAALREQAIPDGPSEELIQRTIARVERTTIPFRQPARPRFMGLRRSAVAAAVTLIASAAIILMVMTHSAQLAFADVLTHIRNAKAVSCNVSFQLALPDGRNVAGTANMLMVDSGWVVTTVGEEVMTISDRDKKMLILNTKDKQAVLLDLTDAQKPIEGSFPNFLDRFKHMDAEGSTRLGERTINDHRTVGFRTQSGTEVWADRETHLPVQVTVNLPAGKFELQNIDWAPRYDEAALSVAIPPGYKTAEQTMDTSEVTEGDVTKMLRQAAEINGGIYPDGIGVAEVLPVFSRWADAQGITPQNKNDADKRAKVIAEIVPIARGWDYMMHREKAQWHYAGKGIKAGEGGKAILWYAPAQGQWRAFYSDGAVRDVAAADLPAGDAVNLDIISAAAALQGTMEAPPK